MKPKLAIWGASGQAIVVADIVRICGEHELVGFIDDVNPERTGNAFYHSRILGGREQLEKLHQQDVHFLILGFGNNVARLELAALIRSKEYQLATALHPQAVIAADVAIGAGSVIKAGVVIDPDVTIGENVIIGSCATLAHGCVVGDGVRISGGANISGYVTIGKACIIGPGAIIRNRVHIGEHTLIGTGATVVKDIPPGVVAYGVPARPIRKIKPDDY